MSFQWNFRRTLHRAKRRVLGEPEALELVRERAEEAADVDGPRARAGHDPDEAGALLDGDRDEAAVARAREALGVRDVEERAVEPVGPAVVAADERLLVAALGASARRAPRWRQTFRNAPSLPSAPRATTSGTPSASWVTKSPGAASSEAWATMIGVRPEERPPLGLEALRREVRVDGDARLVGRERRRARARASASRRSMSSSSVSRCTGWS